VGEDNVATDIVQLERTGIHRSAIVRSCGAQAEVIARGRGRRSKHTKPSGVTSVEARPPGISLESIINQEGPSYSIELVESDSRGTPPSNPLFFFRAEGEIFTAEFTTMKSREEGLTIWLRRLAAPKPVGPAPMTRTSTVLGEAVSLVMLNWGREQSRPYMSGWVILP
jgi:hypothetical protein